MSPSQITPILVVDDDQRICELLSKYLQAQGYIVAVACDASSALTLLKEFQFQLAIIDVMMPGMSGIELTTELRTYSKMPIIMLTAMADTTDRIAGLEVGADDYVTKPFEPKELVLRIERILSRTYPNKGHVTFGPYSFDKHTATLQKGNQPVLINNAETALLKTFTQMPNQIISREDLAPSGDVHPRSIDVQITRLRNKLEENPKRPILIQTIRGKGYRLNAKLLN